MPSIKPWVFIPLFLCLITGTAFAQSEPLALTNLHYFDSYSRTMVSTNRMVIENGTISSIGEDACAGCREINLDGGFVIPGLIDIHQHIGDGGFATESTARKIARFKRNLSFGITTAFNPSLPPSVLSQLSAQIEATPNEYPRFLTASRSIGPEGGWGDLQTSTVSGLKAAIERQIEAGAVTIKLSYDNQAWLTGTPLPLFSKSALKTAIEYAHLRERRVFIHATSVKQAKIALESGADGIISGLIDGNVDAELINLFKTNRAIYIATLAPFHAIADVQKSIKMQRQFDPSGVNSKALYDSLASPIMVQNMKDWWPLSGTVTRRLNQLHKNSVALVRGGVMVGMGTDSGSPAVVFGAALGYEMQLHAEMGIRPAEALFMVTLANARILNIDRTVGSIETGKEADLVVLRKDPTKNAEALSSVIYTIRAGRLHPVGS